MSTPEKCMKKFSTRHPSYDDGECGIDIDWRIYAGGHTKVFCEGRIEADEPTLARAIGVIMRWVVECDRDGRGPTPDESRFWTNCRRRRREKALICDVCPFRQQIEAAEAEKDKP